MHSFESNLFKTSEASTRKNTLASSVRRDTMLTASDNLSQMITINDEGGSTPTNEVMLSQNFTAPRLVAIRETQRDLMGSQKSQLELFDKRISVKTERVMSSNNTSAAHLEDSDKEMSDKTDSESTSSALGLTNPKCKYRPNPQSTQGEISSGETSQRHLLDHQQIQ